MASYSFDVVSNIDMQEMRNAVDQAEREIGNRWDFKGSVSEIQLEADKLVLHSDDEFKLKALTEILLGKMAKRSISLKSLEYGKIEPAAKGSVRQEVKLKQGLDTDTAKKITKLIRDSGPKVTTAIQGDQVRVTGKSKDELQAVIALLKAADLPVDLQFVNYR